MKVSPEGAAMLSISTIPEALTALEKLTGRAWTDSEIFDVVTQRGISLHAAPPIDAVVTIQKMVDGEGLVEKCRVRSHSALAVLFPWQVGQLWISGKTETSHPSNHDEVEGEFRHFIEPVGVIREQVRIKLASLKKIADAWVTAQGGRWISDTKQPNGMKWQRGPDWMFPTVGMSPGEVPTTKQMRDALAPSDIKPEAANTDTKLIEATIPAWKIIKPKRPSGYIPALHQFLKQKYQAGMGKPTSSDFIEAMKAQRHPDIAEVMSDGIKYQTGKKTKFADLDAIRKAISRMTTNSTQ